MKAFKFSSSTNPFLLKVTLNPSNSSSPKRRLYLKFPGEPKIEEGKKRSSSPPTITRPLLNKTKPFALF